MELLDSYSEKITQGCIIDGVDWSYEKVKEAINKIKNVLNQ